VPQQLVQTFGRSSNSSRLAPCGQLDIRDDLLAPDFMTTGVPRTAFYPLHELGFFSFKDLSDKEKNTNRKPVRSHLQRGIRRNNSQFMPSSQSDGHSSLSANGAKRSLTDEETIEGGVGVTNL
jgi:hypothetical protein